MNKTQLQTLSDLVSIAHDEYDGCSSYRDDLDTYDKLLADMKAEASVSHNAPGNAAAMRDLLEKIRREYGWGRIGCRTCVSSESDVERVSDLFEKQIDAALAAPARNCDRYATVEDAKRTYIAERGHVFIWDGDSSERFERWLFAPAEGGAE